MSLSTACYSSCCHGAARGQVLQARFPRPAPCTRPLSSGNRIARVLTCSSGPKVNSAVHAPTESEESTSSPSATRSIDAGDSGRARAPASGAFISTPVIGVSGPYITTASMDGEGHIGVDVLSRELIGPYKFTHAQKHIIHELQEQMMNCSTAFIGVSVMGILLSIAASNGLEVEDAPEVLFSGITVGDVASWMDSLLVAGLLRYGAESFRAIEESSDDKQLAYTFQGLSRLGLIMQQFAIAAGAVSIATTLEASAKWPPLVTLASGLFFLVAVLRSAAMWFVLSKYGTKLDDVEEAMEAEMRCYEAAHNEELPLLDRLAIRIAFNYLLQFNSAGRRSTEPSFYTAATASVMEGGQSEEGVATAVTAAFPDGAPAGSRTAAARAAFAKAALSGKLAARTATVKGMEMLRSIPLPIIARSHESGDGAEEWGSLNSGSGSFTASKPGGEAARAAAAAASEQAAAEMMETLTVQYELTQQEERLVQATQGSLNSAALALVLQAVATGFLLAADLATEHYSPAVGDGIQVLNKAIAAELIFVATSNFDRALYTEGCDVAHLLEGLGDKGITKLFHNLSILAWAVVIAKGVSLLAPWEESSPVFKYISENFSHRAADVVLEGQEVLVQLMQ